MQVSGESCIACGACVDYCPVDAIRIVDGVAIIDAEKCVECGLCRRASNVRGLFRTPCSRACPAGVDVPRYVQHIADGNPSAALQVIRERLPFPSVCGLVCFHPCEASCARGRMDESVAIRALKRFASEHADGWVRPPHPSPSGKRVAVVGSGPAGLTAAHYLARLGHAVVVHEALDRPGGMMLWGIPEYRLPLTVLEQEIQQIEASGVTIRTGSRVESVSTLLDAGYDAVFVATGAHRSLTPGIPGQELSGVISAVELLGRVRRDEGVMVGKAVAVVGGGNSALEAARTARRLGAARVTVYYRRTEAEMPAAREACREALAEGVSFRFQRVPSGIARVGQRLSLQHFRAVAAEPSGPGRPSPVSVPGSEQYDMVDSLVIAVGQAPDLPAGFGLAVSADGVIVVNQHDLSTSMSGVFAGGDAVTGPASVISAIAQGRRAAISIDRHLGGSGCIEEAPAPGEQQVTLREPVTGELRCPIPTIQAAGRLAGFPQVEQSLTADAAIGEASRCLRCDVRERHCIAFEPSPWPRSLRNHFSQAGVAHATTGIAGRGTEEMKTNDVTGRFGHGVVGLGLDVGRPCAGTYFREVEVLTMSLAALGVEFERNNPITMMMSDASTGRLRQDVLEERILSCVVEVSFPSERLTEVLYAVRRAADALETVVSVCAISVADAAGVYPLQRQMDELGIFYRENGKQNAGLGRPRAAAGEQKQ